MNAGIGAAAGGNVRSLADDFLKRLFERRLQCSVPGLNLPARVVGAVVGDRQFERAWHNVILPSEDHHAEAQRRRKE
jgi:hypothetical protein